MTDESQTTAPVGGETVEYRCPICGPVRNIVVRLPMTTAGLHVRCDKCGSIVVKTITTLARPAADGRGDAGVAGWKLVPVEATPEMCEALAHSASVDGYRKRGASVCWMAMLKAAPPPPAPVGLVDAVRAYRAAVDAHEDAASSWGPGRPRDALQAAFKAHMEARIALDATLSGQTGGAVPAGDLRPGLEEAARIAEAEPDYPNATYDGMHVRINGYKNRGFNDGQIGLAILQAASKDTSNSIAAKIRARLAAQPGGSPAEGPRLAGLEHAEHIADHCYQRFMTLRTELPGTASANTFNSLAYKAEGAKQVLDDIRAERARLSSTRQEG